MPWFGSLKDVQQRITSLRVRRQNAETALAEALINDETRAKRKAEDA